MQFRPISLMTALLISGLAPLTASAQADATMPLQPLADKPGRVVLPGTTHEVYYVPSTVDTVQWGYLPNATTKPVLSIPSGATIVLDTLSHEGLVEDQGRDPVKYFGSKGIAANMVLKDAVAITGSNLAHDFCKDGPHMSPVRSRSKAPRRATC